MFVYGLLIFFFGKVSHCCTCCGVYCVCPIFLQVENRPTKFTNAKSFGKPTPYNIKWFQCLQIAEKIGHTECQP